LFWEEPASSTKEKKKEGVCKKESKFFAPKMGGKKAANNLYGN